MGGRGTYAMGKSVAYQYKTVTKIGGVKVLQPIDATRAYKVSNPHFKWGFIWNPSGVLY